MLSKRELTEIIDDLSNHISNYQDCEKLATFITIYDKFYGEPKSEELIEVVIGVDGESEFLRTIDGKRADEVWKVIDELMDAISKSDSRLYEKVLNELK